MDWRFTHLTNYSINKGNKEFRKYEKEEMQGTKWSFTAFKRVLKNNKVDDRMLFSRIKELIVKTFHAVESTMAAAFTQFVSHRSNCFQLFGFDVLIDERLNPYLLEVN